ncbi:MAG: hypothetical protein HY343_13625 [Lentisphaerae bacterium]|nr:hypothetical protein [Lentisphaerota bacterium]
MIEVVLAGQVVDFVRRQAPEPRRWLKQALRNLAHERGDLKPLEGPLSGYYRLRVHTYRVLFAYETPTGSPRLIKCLYAERRNVVYEIFEHLVREQLLGKL